MARRTDRDELVAAWRALAGDRQSEGWQTIPVASERNCRLLAGRRFPGNEEGLLLGFRAVSPPRDELMPQGHGFLVINASPDQQDEAWGWVALCRQPGGSLDLFEMMAADIVATLVKLQGEDGRRLFEVFLARIHAWQEFMRHGARRLLGAEAEIGLYGELEVVDALIQHGGPAPVVVEAWQGPLDGLHDIRLGAGAIEVKSTASTASFQAKVGSLEQLDDSLVSPLYVAGVQLVADLQGMTLPEKIDGLRIRLAGLPATREVFDRLLLHAGFSDDDADGYTRRFRCSSIRVFHVDDNFPRLTRGNVPSAISSAQYAIDLSHADLQIVDIGLAVKELGVEK